MVGQSVKLGVRASRVCLFHVNSRSPTLAYLVDADHYRCSLPVRAFQKEGQCAVVRGLFAALGLFLPLFRVPPAGAAPPLREVSESLDRADLTRV